MEIVAVQTPNGEAQSSLPGAINDEIEQKP